MSSYDMLKPLGAMAVTQFKQSSTLAPARMNLHKEEPLTVLFQCNLLSILDLGLPSLQVCRNLQRNVRNGINRSSSYCCCC